MAKIHSRAARRFNGHSEEGRLFHAGGSHRAARLEPGAIAERQAFKVG